MKLPFHLLPPEPPCIVAAQPARPVLREAAARALPVLAEDRAAGAGRFRRTMVKTLRVKIVLAAPGGGLGREPPRSQIHRDRRRVFTTTGGQTRPGDSFQAHLPLPETTGRERSIGQMLAVLSTDVGAAAPATHLDTGDTVSRRSGSTCQMGRAPADRGDCRSAFSSWTLLRDHMRDRGLGSWRPPARCPGPDISQELVRM